MAKRRLMVNGRRVVEGSEAHAAALKGTASGKPTPLESAPPRAAGTAQAKAAETVTIDRREWEHLQALLASRTREFNASQDAAGALRQRLDEAEETLINMKGAIDIVVRRIWKERGRTMLAKAGAVTDGEYPF